MYDRGAPLADVLCIAAVPRPPNGADVERVPGSSRVEALLARPVEAVEVDADDAAPGVVDGKRRVLAAEAHAHRVDVATVPDDAPGHAVLVRTHVEVRDAVHVAVVVVDLEHLDRIAARRAVERLDGRG